MSRVPRSGSEFGSAQVLTRFALRISLFGIIAALAGRGFGTVFPSLLGLAAGFCILFGALAREPVFGPKLTHWDEAVANLIVAVTIKAFST